MQEKINIYIQSSSYVSINLLTSAHRRITNWKRANIHAMGNSREFLFANDVIARAFPVANMASCVCCFRCRWGANALDTGHVRMRDIQNVKLDTTFMGEYFSMLTKVQLFK